MFGLKEQEGKEKNGKEMDRKLIARTSFRSQKHFYVRLSGRSVREFVEACKKVTGVPLKIEYLPRRPGDYAEVYSDPTKILRELNWSARYMDLEESLQNAWRWQKTHLNGYGPPLPAST